MQAACGCTAHPSDMGNGCHKREIQEIEQAAQEDTQNRASFIVWPKD
jgi:hypothetical protein